MTTAPATATRDGTLPNDDGAVGSPLRPNSHHRPPRPWLAALLSLAAPGLGQLYTWHPWAALVCWAAAQVAVLLSFAILLEVPGPLELLAPLLLLIAVYVAVVTHAWRLARRDRQAVGTAAARGRPSRLALAGALVAAVIAASVVNSAEQGLLRRSSIRAFRIPSASMAPAILVGDQLLVRPRARGDALRRDEIVVYRLDGNDRIKRVAGLAGDTLAMRGGRLVRNGRDVAEPYARTANDTVNGGADDFRWQRAYLTAGTDTTAYHPSIDSWGPLVVPAGRVFVLGDNRHESLDSRYEGFVAADSVVGRPTRIYFSYDKAARRVRWHRIGLGTG